ncbi:Hypothetical protein GSB_153553 [Giardia duodenalis]|uniref:Uncharacterized protein n=1 Tax=Giardia intestinalis TaxID=5741 RepID=V6TSR4_GIAIN|nr:Hypothetical protein GSB_153553 [Giardia intestinalis]
MKLDGVDRQGLQQINHSYGLYILDITVIMCNPREALKFEMLHSFQRNTFSDAPQQHPTTSSTTQQAVLMQEPLTEVPVPQQSSNQSAADYLRDLFLRECDTQSYTTSEVYRATAISLGAPFISVPAPLCGTAAPQVQHSVPSLSLRDSIRALPFPTNSRESYSASSNPPSKATRPRVQNTKTAPSGQVKYLTFSQAPAQESPEFTDPEYDTDMRSQIHKPRESLDGSIEHDLTHSLLFDMANAVSSSVTARAPTSHE